jgi:hypothetical protein
MNNCYGDKAVSNAADLVGLLDKDTRHYPLTAGSGADSL